MAKVSVPFIPLDSDARHELALHILAQQQNSPKTDSGHTIFQLPGGPLYVKVDPAYKGNALFSIENALHERSQRIAA
jgi:hypothetical protein